MRKAIAIDFDGCLCTDAFPAIGEPNWPVIKRAQAEQRAGAGLILWTCREDQLLLDAIAACEGWGLAFDSINESLPDWIEAFGTQPRKVGASEYWDDKAASIPVTDRFFVGGAGDDSIELLEPNLGHKHMELKPCPFCGSTRIFYERYEGPAGERWRCWCAKCLAGIDPGTAQAAGQVREMWNRRPDLPNAPLTLEELREMDGEPVFIKCLFDDELSSYVVVDKRRDSAGIFTRLFYASFDYYGDEWLAYRRKPEEGKNDQTVRHH